jgi:hypothetical protein
LLYSYYFAVIILLLVCGELMGGLIEMRMKSVFTFLIVFIALASFVNAAFDVSVVPVKDSILLKGEASFDISVKNLGPSDELIEVYSENTDWILRRSPMITVINGYQTATFTLYFTPVSGISTGPKGIDVTFRSGIDSSKVVKQFFVYISSGGDINLIDYQPSVKVGLKVNSDDTVDPRENIALKLNLKNRNPLVMKNLEVFLSSRYFSDKRNISLNSFEETTEYFDFRVDSTIVPQDDYVYVELRYMNHTFEDISFPYKIVAYSPFFKKDIKSDKTLFTDKVTVEFSNTGNIEKTEEFEIPVKFYDRLFYSSTPDGKFVKDSVGRYLVWTVNLKPLEKTTITYTADYRAFFYAIFSAILLTVAYYLFRSPIVIKKEVKLVEKREGGIYELKVILFVKNRSRKVVNNVQIIDIVSHLAEVIRESYLGSIKPDKVVRDEKKGTLIKWLVPNVESLEERIITYRIRSKFSILGTLELTKAKVKFVSRGTGLKTTYSNKVSVEAE